MGADKPRTGGRKCACGGPAWGQGSRCRTCVNAERESAATYGPEEMVKDTLLADRPWLRMEAERLAREGAVLYLTPRYDAG